MYVRVAEKCSLAERLLLAIGVAEPGLSLRVTCHFIGNTLQKNNILFPWIFQLP